MNRRSIRFRLTAWYAAILAMTFAAAGLGIWWAIRDSINDTVDEELRARVRAIHQLLKTEGAENGIETLEDELSEQAAIAPVATLFRIASADGHWIYTSPATMNWLSTPPDRASLPAKGRAATILAGGKPYRVLSAPVPSGVVQIGSPLHEFYEMLDHFTWTALLATPVLLCLSSMAGYWMSGRALTPIHRIACTAGEIEAQNLSRRLPLDGTGDELDRLSATLNSMFGRLDGAFKRMAQFTADASHELRTPVSIIRMTAELCRSRPRSVKEYEGALDRILAASERMSGLIENLMVLVRADSGANGMESLPVQLRSLITETCSEMRVLAESAGLSFECEPDESCEVLGDSRALRRLLTILIDNAIKYTRGGGLIRVTLEVQSAAAGRRAIIKVHDTGIGIAAEDLPRIFDRFYRASKDRSRETGGAGLGLSIGHWIAKQHGGEIQVVSTPTEGSTFRVRLPVIE